MKSQIILIILLLGCSVFANAQNFCSSVGESSTASIACTAGTINIINAFWGTPNTCPNPSAGSCNSATSTSTARTQCNGKASCNILASTSTFGDPCVGTVKTLAITYTCSLCTTVGEGSNAVLNCPTGQIISVTNAFYGTPGSCPNPSAGSCNSPNSLSVARTQCNGKTDCNLAATNANFGDPCVGIVKSLSVRYTCSTPPPPSGFCVSVGESSTAMLACTIGTLSINNAFWGTPNTCPNPSAGSCNSGTSTNVVRNQCNGKASCNVPASTSALGDPCVGTVKTLAISYTCRLCTTVGEGSNAVLNCPTGRSIFVTNAFYGTPGSCPNPSAGSCNSPNSLSVARTQCNGKTDCNLAATNANFGDPCVGTVKSLSVRYTCNKCASAAEGATASFSCPSGQSISISSAFYGTPGSCPNPTAGSCNSPNALSRTRSLCNGRRTCNVVASNNNFNSDPCVGTVKRFASSYACV